MSGPDRKHAHIRMSRGFAAICALNLCNCSLSFDLDRLQGGGDAAPGSEIPPQPFIPGSVVTDSPQSSDSGANPADGGAAANSEAAVPGPLSIDAAATGATVDEGEVVTVDAGGVKVDEGSSGHATTINDATALTQAQPGSDAAIESVANAVMGIESGSSGDGSNGATVLPATDSATSDQAAVPSAADAGSWCAQNTNDYTAYCNDFDEPTATIKGTWDALGITNSADSASLAAPVDAPSSPNSLLLTTPVVAAGVVYHEQFTKYVAAGNTLSLQFALKIDAFDPGGKDVSLVRIGYRNNGW